MLIILDFTPNQDNFRRLAVVKHVENVPLIYDIIWGCDTSPDGVTAGQGRFFSSSQETDAEHQKVFCFCLAFASLFSCFLFTAFCFSNIYLSQLLRFFALPFWVFYHFFFFPRCGRFHLIHHGLVNLLATAGSLEDQLRCDKKKIHRCRVARSVLCPRTNMYYI